MKIAICIPCYGDPKAKFMHSLATMMAHTLSANLQDVNGDKIPIQMETFIVSGSMLVESRHRLMAEALLWGADYALCLDADHVFPHDTFCRLWAANKPIIGANYPRRSIPTGPTAAFEDADGQVKTLYTTEEKALANLVEPCAHLGFGVLLINMRVFDVLQDHADKHWEGNFLPLFEFSATKTKTGTVGEDVFFFRKLKEAGIIPWVDHALSWEVGHISEIILTNAHAVVQRDKWAEARRTRGDKFAEAAARLEQEAESEVIA